MNKLDKILDLYRDLCKIPNISSARITKAEPKSNFVGISSVWCQIDLDRNESTKFERNYLVECNNTSVKTIVHYRSNPVEISECMRSHSRNGDFTATLREVIPNAKSGSTKAPEKSEFIDIFSNSLGLKEYSVNLKVAEKHGKVNNTFGRLRFSYGEGHLLYIAEKYRKPLGFFEPKFDEEQYLSDNSVQILIPNFNIRNGVIASFVPQMEDCHQEILEAMRYLFETRMNISVMSKTDEFLFTENWGEKLAEVKEPVICVLDISSGNITTLDNVPKDISPTEPSWCPGDEGIAFVGLCNTPVKLGFGACFNRKSRLYYYNVKEASCETLTNNEAAMKCLRFSPDGTKFVYLQAREGGAHRKCETLKLFQWSTKEDTIVIDIVEDYVMDPKIFPGIYEGSMPERCWALDSSRVLIETIWRSKTEIVVANVRTGVLACITNQGERYGSWRLLDVHQDFVLASNGAPNRPPSLFLARLPPDSRESSDIAWHKLDSEMPRQFDQLISDLFWDVLTLRRDNDASEPVAFSDMQYEALLHLPSRKESSIDKLPPLIAIPHGGPHSTSVATWLPHVAFFVLSGYAVLRINYRGSLGFGDNFVTALPGRIGGTDVLDCKHAIDVALDRLNSAANQNDLRQVFLYGGSHGGFLTAHLIGQYPDYVKAAVAVNPVLNLASKVFETDIPDWNIFETFGTEYDPAEKITVDQLAKMLEKSPIYYVDRVVTPLMLGIGQNDLRVPCAQIKKYAEILRARKIPLRIMSYPGNDHSIAKIDAEANEIINALLWFDNYCQ